MRKFALTLAEEKTRLIPYGRRHWRANQPYPHHFDFLGFRHHLSHDRHGRMAVVRLPSPKSRQKFLREINQWLRAHQHDRPRAQARVLHAKLRGFYQYFGVPHTTATLERVGYAVQWYWYRSLSRRSQKGQVTWEALKRRPWFLLPRPASRSLDSVTCAKSGSRMRKSRTSGSAGVRGPRETRYDSQASRPRSTYHLRETTLAM